jgi:hypothetical protein
MEFQKNGQFRTQVFPFITLTLVGSILHFTDNYVNLDLYEMGKWIEANAWIIPTYWLIMTSVGFLAWQFSLVQAPKLLLYIYSGMAMFSYGHYIVKPIWAWSLMQNIMILGETVPATFLAITVLIHRPESSMDPITVKTDH